MQAFTRFQRYLLGIFCLLGSLGVAGATSFFVVYDSATSLRTFCVGLGLLAILELGKPAMIMIARRHSVGWALYIGFVLVGASYMHSYAVHQDASLDVPAVQARFEREKSEADRAELKKKLEDQTRTRDYGATKDVRYLAYQEVIKLSKQLKELPAPKLSLEEASANVRERSRMNGKTIVNTIIQMVWEFRFLVISELLNIALFFVIPGHGGPPRLNEPERLNAFANVREGPSSDVYMHSRTQARGPTRMNREDIERWIQLKLPRVGDTLSGTYSKWASEAGCSGATVNKAVATLSTAGEIAVVNNGRRGTTLRRIKPSLKAVN